MPTPYDILGVVFGVLPLLGCFAHAYRFLKSRQPPAKAAEFMAALEDARSLLAEFRRHRLLKVIHASALEEMSDALDRIEEESLSIRSEVGDHVSGPNPVVAVLVEFSRHGIRCELSVHLHQSTKLVKGIRAQLSHLHEYSKSPRPTLEQALTSTEDTAQRKAEEVDADQGRVPDLDGVAGPRLRKNRKRAGSSSEDADTPPDEETEEGTERTTVRRARACAGRRCSGTRHRCAGCCGRSRRCPSTRAGRASRAGSRTSRRSESTSSSAARRCRTRSTAELDASANLSRKRWPESKIAFGKRAQTQEVSRSLSMVDRAGVQRQSKPSSSPKRDIGAEAEAGYKK